MLVSLLLVSCTLIENEKVSDEATEVVGTVISSSRSAMFNDTVSVAAKVIALDDAATFDVSIVS